MLTTNGTLSSEERANCFGPIILSLGPVSRSGFGCARNFRLSHLVASALDSREHRGRRWTKERLGEGMGGFKGDRPFTGPSRLRGRFGGRYIWLKDGRLIHAIVDLDRWHPRSTANLEVPEWGTVLQRIEARLCASFKKKPSN